MLDEDKKPLSGSSSLEHYHSPESLEAYERAPTLMGGAHPGSQGEAVVWAPSLWRVRLTVLVLLASITAVIATSGWHLSDFFKLIWLIFVGYTGLSAWISAWRRPRYITTDSVGIAITTASGARALRWEEILSLEKYNSGLYYLKADTSEQLNLYGHSNRQQEQLIALIIQRAKLGKNPHKTDQYARINRLRPGSCERSVASPLGGPETAAADLDRTDPTSFVSSTHSDTWPNVPAWARPRRH